MSLSIEKSMIIQAYTALKHRLDEQYAAELKAIEDDDVLYPVPTPSFHDIFSKFKSGDIKASPEKSQEDFAKEAHEKRMEQWNTEFTQSKLRLDLAESAWKKTKVDDNEDEEKEDQGLEQWRFVHNGKVHTDTVKESMPAPANRRRRGP